jgi:hypothetical protein
VILREGFCGCCSEGYVRARKRLGEEVELGGSRGSRT